MEPTQSGRGQLLLAAGTNIVLPLLTYALMHGPAGMAAVPALLLSGLWPLLDLAVTGIRQRRLDEFGSFVLVGIAIGVLTAALSDDARALFLKDSLTTGLAGLVFLASLPLTRPLTFYFGRRFAAGSSPAQREQWNQLWQYPSFRHVHYRLTTAWGLVLLAEAAARAVLTWQLGVNAMVIVNNVVPYAVIATMMWASTVAGRRLEAASR